MQALYPNKDVYVGLHRSGLKHGKGTYLYKDSEIKYEGEWKDNMRHGKGELFYLGL